MLKNSPDVLYEYFDSLKKCVIEGMDKGLKNREMIGFHKDLLDDISRVLEYVRENATQVNIPSLFNPNMKES